MKRTILFTIFFAIFGLSTTGFAQQGRRQLSDREMLEKQEDRLDKRMERLKKELKLTPQQVKRIRQAIADGQTRRFAVREAAQQHRKQTRAKMDTIRNETRESMKSYLTEDQKTKLEKMQANRGGRRHGKAWFKGIMKRLELTPEQRKQARQIFNAQREKGKNLRNSGLSKDEIRAKRKVLRKEAMAELRKILTPEQKKRFKKFRKNAKKHGKKRGPRHPRNNR